MKAAIKHLAEDTKYLENWPRERGTPTMFLVTVGLTVTTYRNKWFYTRDLYK